MSKTMRAQRIIMARSPPSSGQSPLHGKRPSDIPHCAPLPFLSPSNPLRWASMGTPKQPKSVKPPVSHCKAVCARPRGRGGIRAPPKISPPFMPVPSHQPVTFLPDFSDSAEVRFWCRIKRWLHRISHQPAVRTETAEKRIIPGIPIRFRQSEVAPILGV